MRSLRIKAMALGLLILLGAVVMLAGVNAQSPTVTTTPTATATTPIPTAATPTPSATPISPGTIPGTARYFALGDSLSVDVGASSADRGYVSLFATQALPMLGLDTTARAVLGKEGETSSSMISGDSQLERALSELRARRSDGNAANDVRLITIDIGGNDFRTLTRTSSPCRVSLTSAECQAAVGAVSSTFVTNFQFILESLRDAAGPDAYIIAMAFYNPYSGTGTAFDAAGDLVASGISAQARTIAGSAAVKAIWVDLFGLFKGRGPELTHIAEDDIHPKDNGYALIAQAMAAALSAALVPTAPPPTPPSVGNGLVEREAGGWASIDDWGLILVAAAAVAFGASSSLAASSAAPERSQPDSAARRRATARRQ